MSIAIIDYITGIWIITFCIFLTQASFILNWRWFEPLQVQKLQPELFRIREPRVPNRRWVDWPNTPSGKT